MPIPNPDEPSVCPQAGWSLPKPEALAQPTWRPAAVAFGITLTAWGLIASSIILAMGLVIIIVSLAGWIGDICHERRTR